MNHRHPLIAFASFMTGYLLVYFLVLMLANALFSPLIASSMSVLGVYEGKVKLALIGSPILAAFLALLMASVSISSYSAMGTHRLRSPRFFATGWASFFIANLFVTSAGLQLLVNGDVGRRWILTIGQAGFNLWVFLLAPTLGFTGGVVFNIIANKLMDAQNS